MVSRGRDVRVPCAVMAFYASGSVLTVLGQPLQDALAHLFFALALGGGLVAGAGLLNGRVQAGVAVGALVLMAGQRLSNSAIPAPPSSQWVTALAGPAQLINHEIALPSNRGEWARLVARTRDVTAHVCARGPLSREDGLELWANDRLVERITDALAVGPRPQPTSVGFYRVPLPREVLGQGIVLSLRRSADGSARPIDVCGTFAFRPSAGLDASAYFDGTTWIYPGRTQRGRYVIELRLHDAAGRTLAALY